MLTKNSMEDHVKNISRLIRKGPPPSREMVAEHRSEEHTSELQSQSNLVCRLLLEKKKTPRETAAAARDSALQLSPQEPARFESPYIPERRNAEQTLLPPLEAQRLHEHPARIHEL